jgi:[ribosomal protein S18]-alanine N-acetyltransferase
MTVHFSVARLSALDLARAAAMHAESFVPLGERGWTLQDLAELMASPGVAGLLLRVDDQDAGFALCRIAADEAELLTIAVRPAWRRQGLGRRLLAAIVDHVRTCGARALYLEVGVDNPAARSLYEAQGFSVVGSRPGYYQRGQRPAADGLIMRLTLN